MQIIDAVILLMLGLGAVVGFKKGFIKSVASFVGLIVIIVLSFVFKNYISVILYENLPFFNFGIFKGIELLNIIFYELIAFFIVFTVLSIILRILISLTGIVEKILDATIILAIPSKILGMIFGVLQAYIYIFIVLFVLTQPIFHIDIINESKGKDLILNNTPVISNLANDTVKIYNDIYTIIDKNDGNNTNEVNQEMLDVFLKYKIISVKSATKLIEKEKLHVTDANAIIDKYK